MSHALVLEIYRDYGMKIEDANDELSKRLFEIADVPTHPGQQPRPKRRTPDDAASMATLQAWMRDSDFRGPRG